MVKTVADAFMLELMVLMAADKIADTIKPNKTGWNFGHHKMRQYFIAIISRLQM